MDGIENHSARLVWKVAALNFARSILNGVDSVCHSIAGTAEELADSVWMLEAHYGRQYKALTGVDLNVLVGGDVDAYAGVSPELDVEDD